MSTEHRRPLRAIVLAGGASRRMGADKPEQYVGGRRLLDIALAAVAEAETVVVVGPSRAVPDDVIVVCEEPAGSGPVAAIAAGLTTLGSGPADIAVLAADMPGITCDTVAALAAARGDAPVAVAVDHAAGPNTSPLSGIPQPWPSRWPLPRRGLDDLLPGSAVTVTVGDVTDVDTPEQLAAARAALARGSPAK